MNSAPSTDRPLLDETQAADVMSVSPRTLQAWRSRKRGPAYLRIGGRIKYCPRALNAWMAARHDDPPPRKAQPVTLSRRTGLPPRMGDLIVKEIERGFAGIVYVGPSAYRRLSQALRPIEGALALALCRNGARRPDGTVQISVPINLPPSDPDFDPRRRFVAMTYDPISGQWTSEVGAGQAGFDDFCAHVWHIQGRREGLAARDLLAFIGAAYLKMISEGGVA